MSACARGQQWVLTSARGMNPMGMAARAGDAMRFEATNLCQTQRILNDLQHIYIYIIILLILEIVI